MRHITGVTQTKPAPAYIPFDEIDMGDVLSWLPGYIGALIEAIIYAASGIAARKGAAS